MTDASQTENDVVRRLLEGLAQGNYRPRAVAEFFGTAWGYARTAIGDNRGALRSVFLWSALCVVLGLSILAVPLATGNGAEALAGLIFWVPWQVLVTTWLVFHLRLLRTPAGKTLTALHLPNGLSLLRIALAPLVWHPGLTLAPNSAASPIIVALVAFLVLSDLLDGQLARARGPLTRLGRVLDPVADVVFITCLTLGLYTAGVVPLVTLVLVLVRYPGAFVGVLVLFFAVGPRRITPTTLGKAVSATVGVVMVACALAYHLRPAWLQLSWMSTAAALLAVPVAANILYLLLLAARWRKSA